MLSTTVIDDTNIVDIRYTGKVTTEEMHATRQVIHETIDRHGTIRILAAYGDIELRRIEPRAYLEDLKLTSVIAHVDKLAVLSDSEWLTRLASTAAPALGVTVQTFAADAHAEALAWIRAPR